MDKVCKESDNLEEDISRWASMYKYKPPATTLTTEQVERMHHVNNGDSMGSNSINSDDDIISYDKNVIPNIELNLPTNVTTENETNCREGVSIGVDDGLTRRERKNQRRRELIQCPTCGKTINRGSMSKHAKTHTRVKKFQCEICGSGYDRHDYFLKHMTFHVDKKPYKCSVCGKAFNLARKLISHETIHTGLKPFICSICQTSFTESGALLKHMRGIHEGNKPYECSFCGKTYNESAKVKRHMRIHTGEKPFVCPVCSRAFNDKSAMIKHVRGHKKKLETDAAPASASKTSTGDGKSTNNNISGDDSSGDSSINQETILAKLLMAPNGFDVQSKREIESDESGEQNLPPIHSYYSEMQSTIDDDDNGDNNHDNDRNNNNYNVETEPLEYVELDCDKDII